MAESTSKRGPRHGELDAAHAIDQHVVNGEFDVPGGRVTERSIGYTAIGPKWPRDPRFGVLLGRMRKDRRFVDGDAEAGYAFRPELTQNSVARPTWRAIVGGGSRCTPEEAACVWQAMTRYTDVVYAGYQDHPDRAPGVTTLKKVGGMLHAAREVLASAGAYPNFGNFGAFQRFISTPASTRLHLLPDGQVVLTEVYEGNVEDLQVPESQ